MFCPGPCYATAICGGKLAHIQGPTCLYHAHTSFSGFLLAWELGFPTHGWPFWMRGWKRITVDSRVSRAGCTTEFAGICPSPNTRFPIRRQGEQFNILGRSGTTLKPYLEGHGDLVSVHIDPIRQGVAPASPTINLLTKSP